MGRNRVFLLILLLLVLVGVVQWFVVPRWTDIKKSYRQEVLAKPVDPLSQLTRTPRLADGSFNPLAADPIAPQQHPAQQVGQREWRKRYRPLLVALQPAAESPGVFIYPFLDRTPEGVGCHCTIGWQSVGTAALATWTNARLIAGQPEHMGLPTADATATGPTAIATLDGWLQHALDDPATAAARYVISGLYEVDTQTGEYVLSIRWIDRQAPTAPVGDCFRAATPERGDFAALAAQQRAAARTLAEQVIKAGLAAPRPASAASALDLDQELTEVAGLLAVADSWAVMEGVDRALQLATLFPGQSAPLQAAAYGRNLLNWMLFQYAFGNTYRYEYALQAYGLAQVALAFDPKPALTQLSRLQACAPFGHPLKPRLTAITGDDPSFNCLELLGLRMLVTDDFNAAPGPDVVQTFPAWLVLWLESRQSWFYGQPGNYRPYFQQRLPQWTTHDFYLQAVVQNCRGNGYQQAIASFPETAAAAGNPFEFQVIGSALALRGTLAAETASLLVAQTEPAAPAGAEPLFTEIARLTGLPEASLHELATAGDFYALRDQLLTAFANWPPPAQALHPAYPLLMALTRQAEVVYRDPAANAAPSGFAGLEFSPAERLRLAQRRDHLGPAILATLEGKSRGNPDAALPIMAAYCAVRPGNAAARADQDEIASSIIDQPAALAYDQEALRQITQIYPLDAYAGYRLGRIQYYTGHPEQAEPYLTAYRRFDPFNAHVNQELGELYNRYGYHARAAEYLGRAVQDLPERYDIAIEQAWARCMMGQWNDPEIRETFARPVQLLGGNSQFHRENLDYLHGWAEDRPAARAAVKGFIQAKPHSAEGYAWLAKLAQEDGDTSQALEILAQADVSQAQFLDRAIQEANLSNAYLDLDRPDLAKPHLDAAMDVDEWQGDVIQAMARYAFAVGDYAEAIAQHQRGLERYGFDSNHILGIADAHEKLGQGEQAVQWVQAQYTAANPTDGAPFLAPRLIRYAIEGNQPELAQTIMGQLLVAARRNRGLLREALDVYQTKFPEEGALIEAHLNEIMAEPLTIEQLKALPASAIAAEAKAATGGA